MTDQTTSDVQDKSNGIDPIDPRLERSRWSRAAAVSTALVVVLLAIALLAVNWEAVPEPSSSVGLASALRGWLGLFAMLMTAVATVFLAWFARRVPEGVSGLMKRLDDAEQARQFAEESRLKVERQRDLMLTQLTLPYLHGDAIHPPGESNSVAEVRVGEPLGGYAPSLDISLPMGRLPQKVSLDKENCREWFSKIQKSELEDDGGTADIRYSNATLVVTVNNSGDDETGASLALFPQPANAGDLWVAMGTLRSWPEFREAVKQVATHRLPSHEESITLLARNSNRSASPQVGS